MEFDFKKITIICLSYALFLFTPVFASAADIEVVGADSYWTSGIDTLADGLPDASDAQFSIPNEAQVFAADKAVRMDVAAIPDSALDCANPPFLIPREAQIFSADETVHIGIDVIPNDAIDSTGAPFLIPNEAQVFAADASWMSEFAIFGVDNTPQPTLSKTPVLFVPGLLGTEISDGDRQIWIDPTNVANPLDSDNFLDVLAFSINLKSINALSSGAVINERTFLNQTFDYTKGLMNEFRGQGYVVEGGVENGQDFFTFPYDWRYGVSGTYPVPENMSQRSLTNSDLLKEKIDELADWSPTGKVDVIAHSMGGLVAKKYVMDNSEPKIGKLVYLGVPNRGAPLAAKTLLMGHDFDIFGLNKDEMKKIAQNMPAAYDLLPSPSYDRAFLQQFTASNPLDLFIYGQDSYRDLAASDAYAELKTRGMNSTAIDNMINLESVEFENYDARQRGIDVYNIVGCKSSTAGYIKESFKHDGAFNRYDLGDWITGNNLGEFSNVIDHQTLQSNIGRCQISGDSIQIHSPLNIFVTDQHGNRLGYGGDGNRYNEIPGASFEIIADESQNLANGRKYLFLPDDAGEDYNITLTGTDTGQFTLIDEKIKNGQIQEIQIFQNIPVAADLTGALNLAQETAVITIDANASGAAEKILGPTMIINAQSFDDNIPPILNPTIAPDPIILGASAAAAPNAVDTLS